MILTIPTSEHIPQLRAFRLEFLDAGAPSEGSGSLLRYEDPMDWLAQVARYENPETVPPDRVPCTQYIYVREGDNKIVGMLQIRHTLNETLRKYSGHIGYSVCPSERRKGYATRMLAAALEKCREMGLTRVMLSCRPENEASRRTILKNGGTYESTVHEPEKGRDLERYWIELTPGR